MADTDDITDTPGIRVLVCGGRDYNDERAVYALLDRIEVEHTIAAIIQGGANGADSLARGWCYDDRHHPTVACESFHADWKAHGKAAGPLRNQRMIDEGKPDLVIAFPGGRGTADMVRRAKAAGIATREIATLTPEVRDGLS